MKRTTIILNRIWGRMALICASLLLAPAALANYNLTIAAANGASNAAVGVVMLQPGNNR